MSVSSFLEVSINFGEAKEGCKAHGFSEARKIFWGQFTSASLAMSEKSVWVGTDLALVRLCLPTPTWASKLEGEYKYGIIRTSTSKEHSNLFLCFRQML